MGVISRPPGRVRTLRPVRASNSQGQKTETTEKPVI